VRRHCSLRRPRRSPASPCASERFAAAVGRAQSSSAAGGVSELTRSFLSPLHSPDGAGPLAKRDCAANQPVFKTGKGAAAPRLEGSIPSPLRSTPSHRGPLKGRRRLALRSNTPGRGNRPARLIDGRGSSGWACTDATTLSPGLCRLCVGPLARALRLRQHQALGIRGHSTPPAGGDERPDRIAPHLPRR
jgi:hypothetical protein